MKNVILFRKELFEYFPEIHYFIYRIALFKKKQEDSIYSARVSLEF